MSTKRKYYVDTELENMILESIINMKDEEAIDLYDEVKNLTPPQETLSASSRNKKYNELSYKQLHYIVIGSEKITAEHRANAYVVMIYKLNQEEKVNRFISNDKLLKKIKLEVKQKFKIIEPENENNSTDSKKETINEPKTELPNTGFFTNQ